MRQFVHCFARLFSTVVALGCLAVMAPSHVDAQVFSPRVLLKDQPDPTDIRRFADGIVAKAKARTPREKAEAIWRYFLTDGRFVPPGFWYHIEGWAYEEPKGEVLDVLKLLNSYGFGLCYHIAPVLEAVFEAAGFEDARVWFLTGHAAAEVFYEGAYHYFDSDLMGYTTIGTGDFRVQPVASVLQVSNDASIMLEKRLTPSTPKPGMVDNPWYPADLAAWWLEGITDLFTTKQDNWLYRDTRYAQGHSMEFVLRPGEKLIRYFQPETDQTFYLPFKLTSTGWEPFPTEYPEYGILMRYGPRSIRDSRRWATGRIEYRPPLTDPAAYLSMTNARLPNPSTGSQSVAPANPALSAILVFEVQSPYVIIDGAFSMQVSLPDDQSAITLETSTDLGSTWDRAAAAGARFQGKWDVAPTIRARTADGILSSISGRYGYLVRLTLSGAATVMDVTLNTRIEMNPRTLPELVPGVNQLTYAPGARRRRWALPVRIEELGTFAMMKSNVRYVSENFQGVLQPQDPGRSAVMVFELSAPDGGLISGFDAGGRFLDIQAGLAPDKLTAEPRNSAFTARPEAAIPDAGLEWALLPDGPYTSLWQFDPLPGWKDYIPIVQSLRWPEVDRQVRGLPAGTRKVYVRYSLRNMALDDVRLAAISDAAGTIAGLQISHLWTEDGQERQFVQRVDDPSQPLEYAVPTTAQSVIVNRALILETIATQMSFTLSGSTGVPGATVTLSGGQSATTTSDGSGAYSFPNLPAGGSYTVTPSKATYAFTPPSAQFINLAANQTSNFTATQMSYTVSGNAGVPGATVTLSGGQSATTTSDGSGAYSFPNLPAGGSYTVTPKLSGYSFTPANVTVLLASANQTANFTATRLAVTLSLDRTRLNYGANQTVTTPAQKVLLSYSGGGTTSWTASTNQSWLQVVPASGSGPARLTISVAPGSMPPLGLSNATVTISAPNAVKATLTVDVTMTRRTTSAAPFGTFDTPSNNAAKIAGSIAVTGWAMDDIYVSKVQIWRDPIGREPVHSNGYVYIGDAIFVPNARPDMEGLNPTLPFSYQSGWGYLMLTNGIPNATGPQGNGTIRLWAIATDIEGNTTNLGSKTITLDNANSKKPFGAIDAPGPGGTAAGSYTTSGWVLTPPPNIISAVPTKILVVIDGVEVGRVTYGQPRGDVAAYFPGGYRNIGGPGASYTLDTTQYADKMHTISWNAYDDAGNADGIGSRYFFIENGGAACAAAPVEPLMTTSMRSARPRPQRGRESQVMTVQELERLIIALPAGEWNGAHLINGTPQPLPVGSTLDNANGVFYWQLGPGFLGRHGLLFTNADGAVHHLEVNIEPKVFTSDAR